MFSDVFPFLVISFFFLPCPQAERSAAKKLVRTAACQAAEAKRAAAAVAEARPSVPSPSTKALFAAAGVAQAAAEAQRELEAKVRAAPHDAALAEQLEHAREHAAIAAAVVAAGRHLAPSAQACAAADKVRARLASAESKARAILAAAQKALAGKYQAHAPLSSQIAALLEVRNAAVDKAAVDSSAVGFEALKEIAEMNQRLKLLESARGARRALKRVARLALVASAVAAACQSTSGLDVEHIVTIHVIDPEARARVSYACLVSDVTF